MVIGLFGESCAGKSMLAEALQSRTQALIYTGKEYLKLAKTEPEARKVFSNVLKSGQTASGLILYVISELDQLPLLPQGALRVHVSAELQDISDRFAHRMHGTLPASVAAMLEKRHGMFDDQPCDLRVSTTQASPGEVADLLLAALAEKSAAPVQ